MPQKSSARRKLRKRRARKMDQWREKQLQKQAEEPPKPAKKKTKA